ncbi:LapA family protein [Ornithinibacillus xuwenensis]|jgi:lipopolysaccharide assembly protein A|uniref:Lipopolysaccharide assembly protein LapA domain-containing protein n=1 Tax=Ornithinibacillus xuwenensis TaxID=3144668 RepID=A0ABU9XCV0_9BACI
MRGQSYVILAIIFMILVAIFAVTNVNPVEVTYFFWRVESPLILVILFSVLMGGIITAAVGMLKMFKMQREMKLLRLENEKLARLLEENDIIEPEEMNQETNQDNEETKGFQ